MYLCIILSVKEEPIKEVWNYFELNGNENIAYESLWGAAKPVLRWKFIPLNAYIRKKEII